MIPSPRPADRARLPVIRVRHPCRDAAELQARFAGAIAARGIFVPTSRARPVGAHVELVLELRDGSVVRGEALAVDSAPGDAGGVTYRFVRLFEGSVPLGAAAAEGAAPAAGAPAFEELFTPDEERELVEGGAVVEEAPAGVEIEETIDVPLRKDVIELRDASEEADRQRAGRVRRRRMRFATAGTAALVLVAIASYLAARGQEERSVDAHVAMADARLADGRLAGGGDSALDHLVAARAIRPADPVVRERLRLVADKLEELADRALARGDYAEAAVHLTAASQAEPDRKRIHVRLGELARTRGRSREAPPTPRAGDAPPGGALRTAPRPE